MSKNNNKTNKYKILGLVIAVAVVIMMLGMGLFGSSEVSAEEKVRINLQRIDESINKAIEKSQSLL